MKYWNCDSKGFRFISLSSVFALGLMIVISTGGACTNNSDLEPLKAKIISPKNDVNLKKEESVFFKGFASGGTPPYSYFWNFGLAASDSSSQNTGEVIFNYEGAYMVTLTVTDSNGTKDSASVRILVTSSEPSIK